MEKEQTASRVPIQNVYVKEVYKNNKDIEHSKHVKDYEKMNHWNKNEDDEK